MGVIEDLIMTCEEETAVARRIFQYDSDLKWETEMTGVTVIGERDVKAK